MTILVPYCGVRALVLTYILGFEPTPRNSSDFTLKQLLTKETSRVSVGIPRYTRKRYSTMYRLMRLARRLVMSLRYDVNSLSRNRMDRVEVGITILSNLT